MVFKSAHQRRSVVALKFGNSNCDMTQNLNQFSNSKRLGDMFIAPNYVQLYLKLTHYHCHLNCTQDS